MNLTNEVLNKLVAMPAVLPKTGEAILRTKRNRKVRAALIATVVKGKSQ